MSRIRICAFVIIGALSTCLATHNVRHSDLKELGADCSPRDTCANGGLRNIINSNCECDDECPSYDDCCIDANATSSEPVSGFKCIADASAPYQGAYAVSQCQTGWVGDSQIRQRCEILNDMSDPLVAAPVTLLKERVTYKNRFCAECNNADIANLRSWIISMKCDSLESVNKTGNITNDYIREKLSYRSKYPNKNKWGIYYWDKETERKTFFPCDVIFIMPESVRTAVRLCRPRVISTCASSWRQQNIRKNCEAYMAVVHIGSIRYRNVHCALCNNAKVKGLSCTLGLDARRRPPMSFTLLLDVNLSDGNRVGEVNTCSRGETFDPFHNRCRRLTCALPGYKLVGSRCVRQ